jgi:hypothetical protein
MENTSSINASGYVDLHLYLKKHEALWIFLFLLLTRLLTAAIDEIRRIYKELC